MIRLKLNTPDQHIAITLSESKSNSNSPIEYKLVFRHILTGEIKDIYVTPIVSNARYDEIVISTDVNDSSGGSAILKEGFHSVDVFNDLNNLIQQSWSYVSGDIITPAKWSTGPKDIPSWKGN